MIYKFCLNYYYFFQKITIRELTKCPQHVRNGQWERFGQTIFVDGPTNPIVNRNIHETDENELQTPKNDKPNHGFSPVDKNIDAINNGCNSQTKLI